MMPLQMTYRKKRKIFRMARVSSKDPCKQLSNPVK